MRFCETQGCDTVVTGKARFCKECAAQRQLEAKRRYEREKRKKKNRATQYIISGESTYESAYKPKLTIAQVNQMARDRGMTYGQMVAKLKEGKRYE